MVVGLGEGGKPTADLAEADPEGVEVGRKADHVVLLKEILGRDVAHRDAGALADGRVRDVVITRSQTR